jgi:hypothetical protein
MRCINFANAVCALNHHLVLPLVLLFMLLFMLLLFAHVTNCNSTAKISASHDHKPRLQATTASHDRKPRPQATTASHDRKPRPQATTASHDRKRHRTRDCLARHLLVTSQRC